MSDHDAVSFEILINLEKQTSQPRKYSNAIKPTKIVLQQKSINLLEISFQQNPYKHTIDDNLHFFKTTIMEIIEK